VELARFNHLLTRLSGQYTLQQRAGDALWPHRAVLHRDQRAQRMGYPQANSFTGTALGAVCVNQ
jgi:hypothetical protein